MSQTATGVVSQAELVQAAKRALANAKYSFQENSSTGVLSAPFGGDIVNYEVNVFCGHGYLTVVSQLPLTVAAHRVNEALGHLNRLSVETALGNYQLMTVGNKVQFKLGLPSAEVPRDEQIVAAVFIAADRIQKVTPDVMKWLPAT